MKHKILFLLILVVNLVFSQRSGTQETQKVKPEEKVFDLSELQTQINLPDSLEENSGIEYINGFIYTFNDSGGKAEVYKINPTTGEILQTIILTKIDNVDFEDIAYDGKNLYIADFGNNYGNRDDLSIYFFNLNSIDEDKTEVKVHPKKLKFYFKEQPTLTKQEPLTTNFDLESMVFLNGKIHIFTKEWTHLKTTHYTLETQYTIQMAKIVETFNTQCCITAADGNEKELYMTGYTKDGQVFLWKFTDFKDDKFFNGKAERIFLGLSPSVGQIEGITINEEEIFISGENFNTFGLNCPQKLYHFSKEALN